MRRTGLQVLLAVVFLVAAVVTAVWPGWMESLGFDPDHGDGSAEWVFVAVFAALACCSGAFATWNRRFRMRAHAESDVHGAPSLRREP